MKKFNIANNSDYRSWIMSNHPDKNSDKSEDERKEIENNVKLVNDARSVFKTLGYEKYN